VVNCVHHLAKALAKLGHSVGNGGVTHGHAFDFGEVYTSHGIYPKGHPNEQYNDQLVSNIAGARVVTAVSRWTADQFKHLNVEPKIIHNGVDVEGLQQYRGQNIGYILWGKNTADETSNPWAFIELAQKHPDLEFVMTVVPPGDIPANIRVIGAQSYPDMMKWLSGASVYVSTGTENFPLQVLESMALGVPVVALPRGGVAEVEGILAGDDLDDLLAEAYLHYDQYSAQVFAQAQEYDWLNIAKQYVEVYRDVDLHRPSGKVSVIIPVYNLAHKVERAVKSVLSQTTPPDEIVVVDDGSKDDPQAALNPYLDRIKFFRQENQGVSAARNFGIEQSSGEFICCLDADDALSPNFLQLTKMKLEEDLLNGIAYSGMAVYSEQGRQISDLSGTWNPSLKKLAQQNFIPCANLFRKTAWQRAKGYKNINPSWEDYDLWLSILEKGFKAVYTPRARLLYTQSDAGRSGLERQGNHSNLLRATVDGYHPNLYGNSGLVSFIIPCYNQWEYVEEAVESAWHQDYPHLEVIVVDDKSTLDPYEVGIRALDIADRFPKTRFIYREKNGGLSACRNTGIVHAQGDWIVPLDADDKVDPRFVSECLKVVYNTTQYAYTDLFIWHNYGQGPLEKMETATFSPERLIEKHQHACTILLRRDWLVRLGGYDEAMLDGWEDYELVVRLVKSGHLGTRVPIPLFYYRWRENSMRQQADKKQVQLGRYIWTKHNRDEYLMSCCGGKTIVNGESTIIVNPGDVEVPPGYVLVSYKGQKSGDMSKRGGEHRVYQYSSVKRFFPVHQNDLMAFSTALFSVVTPVTPEPVVEPVEKPPITEVFPEGTDDLTKIPDLTEELQTRLYSAGINTYQRLIATPDTELSEIVGKKLSRKFKQAALTVVRETVGV
jgi:glycosyltransferase involved in cell wall biosynthesis